MITLRADNRYVTIRGAPPRIIRKLEKVTSYKVAGAHFSEAFRNKFWDGREHLLKYSRKHGYRVPVGLLEDLLKELERIPRKYKLIDTKEKSIHPRDYVMYPWNTKVKLRPYQEEAVAAVMEPGPMRGRGIIMMPIRSGKTKTLASIINELAVRTLVVVPSQMLLHQTRESLTDSLVIETGIIGDSEWDEQNITVATAQSLSRARESKDKKVRSKYKAMLKRYGLITFDECHHLKGDVWHKVMMDFDTPFKLGLSATAYLDNERESERGVIWLKACCGPIRIDVPTSRLIEERWLLRPQVELYPVTEPDLSDQRWSAELQNEAVYENETRNRLIAELAEQYVDKRLTVLIVTNRLNQVALLAELMEELDVDYATVTGTDPSATRRERVDSFIEGDVDVLIGTVFGEGVDIPEIEVVINAEGGRDVKATVQRMRNLTPNEGKEDAVFIDFMDMTNPYFARHSRERLQVYRSESAFNVRLVRD